LIPFNLLAQTLSLESLAFWQKSEDILYSPRQVSLGGQSSVRGFKEQTLYGSTGGYWRTQLNWSHAVPWAWMQPLCQEVGVALAWDFGAIERDAANRYTGQHGRLSGHALELSARGRHARVRLTLARAEKRPAAFRKHETPLWMRVDLSY
ncbi:MAG: ShlB/FhaC/HecB family hemolysin secretion/activation protein, partial [Azoarcus sp.]|nr:ShlB/FhaC/HecB family hemolysin secretion/activation protein [Azoarcus sp.]